MEDNIFARFVIAHIRAIFDDERHPQMIRHHESDSGTRIGGGWWDSPQYWIVEAWSAGTVKLTFGDDDDGTEEVFLCGLLNLEEGSSVAIVTRLPPGG